MTEEQKSRRWPRYVGAVLALGVAAFYLWPSIAGTRMRELCTRIRPGMTVEELKVQLMAYGHNPATGGQVVLSEAFGPLFKSTCSLEIADGRVLAASFHTSLPFVN